MPFCYSPWTNIDISPQGDMTPCCKFRTKYYNDKFNIQHNTLEQYTKSEFLTSIKSDLKQGNWPVGCERCRIEEENSIQSKRQLDWERWKDNYTQCDIKKSGFITASVAFGNTCNFTCITCNSYSSSRWYQEFKEVNGMDIKPYHFHNQRFVDDLIVQAPNLIHLDIPGGEPFLGGVKEQQNLLRHYTRSKQSKEISLHYTTNGSIFPEEEWWELWKDFKEVDIQISIDGVGSRYEYIRFGGDWTVLNESVDRYIKYQSQKSNIKLSVSHTVSAYNILYLDEFFDWSYNKGLPRPWLGRVHYPEYMTPSVWTGAAKSYIVDQLKTSKYDDTKIWAELLNNTDDSNYFELFQQRVKEHDQYRDTNFKQVFPELAEYI